MTLSLEQPLLITSNVILYDIKEIGLLVLHHHEFNWKLNSLYVVLLYIIPVMEIDVGIRTWFTVKLHLKPHHDFYSFMISGVHYVSSIISKVAIMAMLL